GQLPHGRVPLRGGIPEDGLRPRCGDLARDASDRRWAERVLRAPDGEDRRRPMRTRRGRYRQWGWNALGIAVTLVLVFPVYWMVSTAFKPDDGIIALKPQWIPLHPTLDHFRAAMKQPYFWDDVKNSLIIVLATVVIAMVFAFLAAIALAKYRFTGLKVFIV